MSGPVAHVTAITSTGLTVLVDSITGLSAATLKLQTRALGSAASWDTRDSNATPAANISLSTSALTAGTEYEWRVTEEAGSTINDGTHGIASPASSIWATLLSTVETVLTGLGFTVYKGEMPPPSYPALTALLWTLPEKKTAGGTNVAELDYPVEVEFRLSERSDTGELRTEDVATYQRALESAFDGKGLETYPSVTGLMVAVVEVSSKTEARPGADDFGDETRARARVVFSIWEART